MRGLRPGAAAPPRFGALGSATHPASGADGRPGAAGRDLLLLLLLSTLWGASYTFIRIGVATIPPVTLIAARTLIAGGILAAAARARGVRLPREWAVWRGFAVQACLNSVLPFTLLAWAERTVQASLAVILNSLSPVFAYLLGLAFARQEAVGVRRLFGVAIGLGGVCLIVGVNALHGLGGQALAQLAIVAATVCYGGAVLFGRRFRDLDPILPAMGSMLCGALILLPASVVVDRPWTLSPSEASLQALLGLSVASTALAFVIYFRLLSTLGAVATSSQAYIRVPIGVAIGAVTLGERPSPTLWAGLVCVVAAVVAITVPTRRKLALRHPQRHGDAPRRGDG